DGARRQTCAISCNRARVPGTHARTALLSRSVPPGFSIAETLQQVLFLWASRRRSSASTTAAHPPNQVHPPERARRILISCRYWWTGSQALRSSSERPLHRTAAAYSND